MISGDFSLAEEFTWILSSIPSRRFVSKNTVIFGPSLLKMAPGESSNGIFWNKYNPNTDKVFFIDERRILE